MGIKLVRLVLLIIGILAIMESNKGNNPEMDMLIGIVALTLREFAEELK